MSVFAGKSVAITGGSSGLGLALAHELARRGSHVTLLARNAERLAAAQRELTETTPQAEVDTIAVDVGDSLQAEAAFAQIGELDVLINSAGILNEGRFDEQPREDFESVIQTNLIGTANATRAALPLLKRSRGRLVNIASMAGMIGVYGYTAYSASKHALVGFTESLRYELESDGVKVHLVCPTEFESPMVSELNRTRSPENRAHVLTIPVVEVEKIVAATISGIERGKFLIVPGLRARAAVWANRQFPGMTRRVGDRVVKRARDDAPA